jgi:hypothetical protein
MVSMEFFIDKILPAELWPWGWPVSNRNGYQEYFLGVTAAGAYGWQPYHLRLPTVLKSGSLNLLEPYRIALPFTFTPWTINHFQIIILDHLHRCKKALITFEMSVRPSVRMYQRGSYWKNLS